MNSIIPLSITATTGPSMKKSFLNVNNRPLVAKTHIDGLALKSKDIFKKVEVQHKSPPDKKLFACPICKDRFYELAQALGGHMSKSHPNQSQAFAKKLKVRKER
jgi:hypothetical protein